MSQMIIYKNGESGNGLLNPNLSCGIPIYEIARKDVPKGMPFLILDSSQIPEDQTFFNAWEVDFSNPHGYGIGSDDWFAENGG